MPNRIYLDYASTTPLNDEVYDTYIKLLKTHYVNSESLYDEGIYINRLLNQARENIASYLNVKPTEVIFTSCASESNNTALKGVALNNTERKRIITSKVEHSSILNACKELEQLGYDVIYLNVDQEGRVRLDELKKYINEDTILVSIMWVNNETGAINDIDSIKKIVKEYSRCYLHVDGVQALGKLDLDLSDIDMVSFSAHKIFGLKGSGLLIKKEKVQIMPLIAAGQQEFGIRGGTSNAISNIVFAKTLKLALQNQKKYQSYLDELYNYLWQELSKIKEIKINTPKDRHAYVLNFSTNVFSEIMLNALNKQGIMVSALSTCHSAKTSSHVLEAMNLETSRIRCSLRVSISYPTKKDDIDYLIKCIKENIKKYGNSSL